MPPLNKDKDTKHHLDFIKNDPNNNTELIKKAHYVDEDDEVCKEFKYFHVRKPVQDRKTVRYIYIDDTKFGLVWPNITMFFVLHIYYAYALYRLSTERPFKTWFFRKYIFDILRLQFHSI